MHSNHTTNQAFHQQLADNNITTLSERQRYWVDQFLMFHAGVPISELEQQHLYSFLSHLSSLRYLSPLHQADALSALLQLFRRVLKRSVHGLQLHYVSPAFEAQPRWQAVG